MISESQSEKSEPVDSNARYELLTSYVHRSSSISESRSSSCLSPLPARSALHFVKLALEDSQAPFGGSPHSICRNTSTPSPNLFNPSNSKNDELLFYYNLMNDFLKAELGSLHVPEKFVQNFNAFRMRQSRRFKEYKLVIELLKKENTALIAEVNQWKRDFDECSLYHAKVESELLKKVDDLSLNSYTNISYEAPKKENISFHEQSSFNLTEYDQESTRPAVDQDIWSNGNLDDVFEEIQMDKLNEEFQSPMHDFNHHAENSN